jgi:predicted RNase H-like HicB family nuclease
VKTESGIGFILAANVQCSKIIFMKISYFWHVDNRIKRKGDNTVEVQLSLLVFKQGDYYVALCPSLELSSYGISVDDAKAGFDDAMNLYIEHSIENGTLEKDLLEHGWKIEQKPVKIVQPTQIELNIPTGQLISQFNQNWYMPIR